MRFLEHPSDAADRQRLAMPPACPKCQSQDACSAAKQPTANSYWRCLRCGEVWNPSLVIGFSQRRWNR
jgi:hypothetical protein